MLLTRSLPIVAPAPKMAAFPSFLPNFFPVSENLLWRLGIPPAPTGCIATSTGMLPYDDGTGGATSRFSSTRTYDRGKMPSSPVRSLTPFHHSAFMYCVTATRSFACRGRSPASVAVYAYSATACVSAAGVGTAGGCVYGGGEVAVAEGGGPSGASYSSVELDFSL